MKTSIKQLLLAFALLAIGLVSSEAFAVGVSYLNATDVTTATDNITATVTDVKDSTFPLLFMVLGITVAFGLFKKFVKIGAR